MPQRKKKATGGTKCYRCKKWIPGTVGHLILHYKAAHPEIDLTR